MDNLDLGNTGRKKLRYPRGNSSVLFRLLSVRSGPKNSGRNRNMTRLRRCISRPRPTDISRMRENSGSSSGDLRTEEPRHPASAKDYMRSRFRRSPTFHRRPAGTSLERSGSPKLEPRCHMLLCSLEHSRRSLYNATA